MSSEDYTLYRNRTNHVIGVVKIRDYDNRPNGIAVGPGEEVYLNLLEQRLTRNAPRREEDNPLANGDLELVDETARSQEPTPVAPSEPEPTPTPLDAPEPVLPPGAVPAGTPLPPASPPVEDVAAKNDTEETAAVETHQQETGAAVEPEGQAPEGEYAQSEEVATPDAPARTGSGNSGRGGNRQSGGGRGRSRSKRRG